MLKCLVPDRNTRTSHSPFPPGIDVARQLEGDRYSCFVERAAEGGSLTMATRLYVGNLPYSATEDELRQLFSRAGTVVSVDLPIDRATGRPRGFGFVEMESSAGAQNAIRELDGYRLDNRSIRVEIPKEREARPPAFRRPGGRGTEWGGERRERRGREGGRAA